MQILNYATDKIGPFLHLRPSLLAEFNPGVSLLSRITQVVRERCLPDCPADAPAFDALILEAATKPMGNSRYA